MEHYSTIKKSEILPFATTWMDLEGIMLSEISQTGKRQIPHDFTYMWNLNNRTNITKQKQSQIQRTNWWLPEGVRGIGKIGEGD